MKRLERQIAAAQVVWDIRSVARPLDGPDDLTPLLDRIGASRYVCVGEASHGTHEYYQWRGLLSRRLIEEHGFTWIGVEGDWPDCWRINRWVRGQGDQDLDVSSLLARFERWPTWMWANQDVADFLVWLRGLNASRPERERVGFYGLDVYSLWDSLREIIAWLDANEPDAVPAAMRAWRCFIPYGEHPSESAWATRLVPESCEDDVVALLVAVGNRTGALAADDEEAFDAQQNAEVAADAEHYYRMMVRGDRESWNVRDHHMADTIDRLSRHLGPGSKGLVWQHNSHIGDARATDMASDGLVNVGQLLRERHSAEGVALVGFASHRGAVLAAGEWGSPEVVLPVPEARAGSHEDLLHRVLGRPAVLAFRDNRSGPWLSAWMDHRAIGVVYQPAREAGNYVPTCMGARYDGLLWFERTRPLRPLQHEPVLDEPNSKLSLLGAQWDASRVRSVTRGQASSGWSTKRER
jgi:erythromycin esterase